MKLTISNLGKEYRNNFWGLKDFSLEIQPDGLHPFCSGIDCRRRFRQSTPDKKWIKETQPSFSRTVVFVQVSL